MARATATHHHAHRKESDNCLNRRRLPVHCYDFDDDYKQLHCHQSKPSETKNMMIVTTTTHESNKQKLIFHLWCGLVDVPWEQRKPRRHNRIEYMGAEQADKQTQYYNISSLLFYLVFGFLLISFESYSKFIVPQRVYVVVVVVLSKCKTRCDSIVCRYKYNWEFLFPCSWGIAHESLTRTSAKANQQWNGTQWTRSSIVYVQAANGIEQQIIIFFFCLVCMCACVPMEHSSVSYYMCVRMPHGVMNWKAPCIACDCSAGLK